MTPWRDPRTGLNVYRPLQRRTQLRQQSVKLAAARRAYKKRRDEFLIGKWCIRCGGIPTEVHHARGRVGADLLDETTWRPACRDCHDYIGDHPTEAIERGWSLPRIGRAS